MNGKTPAVDTNFAIAVLNGDRRARDLAKGCAGFVLLLPVYAELVFGALNSGNPAANLERLVGFEFGLSLLSPDKATAQLHAQVRLKLRKLGRPIPDPDVWIAALCLQHGLPLATRDVHFDAVEGLELLKW